MHGEPLTTMSWTSMVAPIMKLDKSGDVAAFLGTGFVVAASTPVLVTAKHVIAGCSLGEGECYYAYFQADDGTVVNLRADAGSVMCSERYDVAALRVGDTKGVTPLFLDPTEIPLNEQVACREFSGNHFRLDRESGSRRSVLRPRNHVGNAMCWFTSDFPESRPTPSVEFSFPALQGASGAPVIRDKGLHVVAILVANSEQELVPSQVLRVDGGDGSPSEEIRYHLPIGKGLAAPAIIEFLQEECGIQCAEPPPIYLAGEII